MPLKLKFLPENLKTSSEDRNYQFQTTGVKTHCYVARNVLIIFIFIAKLIQITDYCLQFKWLVQFFNVNSLVRMKAPQHVKF
jgi:hypothetical protein